jgi:hypothetical protein
MNKDKVQNNRDKNKTNDKERVTLLYTYGGLEQLDCDYYQGECPEVNH